MGRGGTSVCSSGDNGAYSRSSYIRSDGSGGGGDDSSGDGLQAYKQLASRIRKRNKFQVVDDENI
jgi:hypothetical protein